MRERTALLVAAGTGLAVALGAVGFAALRALAVGEGPEGVDPSLWAARFPRHVEATLRTREDAGATLFGGSARRDRLQANPFRGRAFEGHAFALEQHSARGHAWAWEDVRASRRTREVAQPAACAHCHAAEAPGLVASLGWEGFHAKSLREVAEHLHHGTGCADCHHPATLALRITRPAFVRALAARGVDVARASRAELRTLVCAQCHTEYYFRGEGHELAHPWVGGLALEAIERHYDEAGFHDWVHPRTGTPLIKVQHPEYELQARGTHARHGVACADCHMPRVRDGGLAVTDHRIRSPLTSVAAACLGCHEGTEAGLRGRAEAIQRRTAEQLALVEGALDDLMGALAAAREAGAGDEALAEARLLHRGAQLRWDFVDAENSTGFHASAEASRLLLHAVDLARRGERAALQALHARER
jgi:nitrite reductase (cytochrome c-552)